MLRLSKAIIAIVAVLALNPISGCSQGDSLEQISERGELVVVSRNGPATFFRDRNGYTGFEHLLARRLADHLGVELKMVSAFSFDALTERLERSEADIAAPGLLLASSLAQSFVQSPAYSFTTPQVVYRAGDFRPRKLADLQQLQVVVMEGSHHGELLQQLAQAQQQQINWKSVEAVDGLDLLAMVEAGEADLAVVDSHEFQVQQSLVPQVRVAFSLADPNPLYWLLPSEPDQSRLIAEIEVMLAELDAGGEMARMREHQFGHTDGVSRIGSYTFSRNMRRKLPKYQQLIEQVAGEYQMDPHLLAAIAYQESHWNPRARSPTGVRGMMMLTQATARELGVDNRLDPEQSLRGGARYFKNIKRRLPGDIYEPDRTWLALAAYNVGMGHLEDARVLTQRQGGDPHLWTDIRQRLPLLQQSKYYKTLRYGYARGSEPVTYVQNIRHYQNILKWQGIANDRPLPPIEVEPLLPDVLTGTSLNAL